MLFENFSKKASTKHQKIIKKPAKIQPGGVPKSMPGEVLEPSPRPTVPGDRNFIVFHLPGGCPGEPRTLNFLTSFLGFFLDVPGTRFFIDFSWILVPFWKSPLVIFWTRAFLAHRDWRLEITSIKRSRGVQKINFYHVFLTHFLDVYFYLIFMGFS